jgi:hypothetical protein
MIKETIMSSNNVIVKDEVIIYTDNKEINILKYISKETNYDPQVIGLSYEEFEDIPDITK